MRLLLNFLMTIILTLSASIIVEFSITSQASGHSATEFKRFESVINPGLPKFIFSLEITRPDVDIWHVRRIHIYKADQDNEIQILSVGDMETPNIEDYFVIQDINFDGYKDIRLLKYWGATGNLIFSAWIYDPKTGIFKYQPEFEKLCTPEIHPDTKTITTHYNGGMAGQVYSKAVYQWSNDKLEAVYIEKQNWVNDSTGGHFDKTISNDKENISERNKLNAEALQLFKHGDLDKAITKWKEIESKLVPYDAEVLNNIGFAYYQMAKKSKNTSDYSKAEDYLEKALRVEPDRWSALLNAGDLEYDVGYIVSALRHYDKLLQVKPDYKYADKIRTRIEELKLEPKEIGIEVTVYKYYFGKRHTTYTRVDKNNVIKRLYSFQNGTLIRSQNITNGIENGDFRAWNEAGDLQTVGQMEMGKKIGKWIEYYPNGNIKKVLIYNADGTSTDVTKEYVKN